MKIKRSTRCTLKYANKSKLQTLDLVLVEYARVVNSFIDIFWLSCPAKAKLLKPVVDSVPTWFTARLRQVAAREAIDLIRSVQERDKEQAVKPVHGGRSMSLSSTVACLQPAKASSFDCWLHLNSIGQGIILNLPIKLHKHFNILQERGRRLESYVISRDRVQFCFERETGPKKAPTSCIGIDTGINALASTSEGRQFGRDIKQGIERIKRCKHGSRGQLKARRALRQRMAEVAKEVTKDVTLVVVENLKGITKGTRKPKRRLGRNIRRSIGSWNVRYWLTRLQQTCEERNVSFRTVSPYKTSQMCPACNHTDRRNRNGEKFLCLSCGYTGNADITASRNILSRFLTGPYGAGCKPSSNCL